MESDSESEEFFDADNDFDSVVITSPTLSVPMTEEDPSDVEEDRELHEDNDTSSEFTCSTEWWVCRNLQHCPNQRVGSLLVS